MSALETVKRIALGNEEESEEPEPIFADVDKDALYDALSSDRRRYIIDQVGSLNIDERVSLSELANGLAYVESNTAESIPDVKTSGRKRCYVSLYQTHLPRLGNSGLIDYDERSKTVSPTEATQLLFQVMRAVNQTLADGRASA